MLMVVKCGEVIALKKSADYDCYKAAGVMRPKTRRRFTQIKSKCLAGGYNCAIIIIVIHIIKI